MLASICKVNGSAIAVWPVLLSSGAWAREEVREAIWLLLQRFAAGSDATGSPRVLSGSGDKNSALTDCGPHGWFELVVCYNQHKEALLI